MRLQAQMSQQGWGSGGLAASSCLPPGTLLQTLPSYAVSGQTEALHVGTERVGAWWVHCRKHLQASRMALIFVGWCRVP